jgi:hypothetical protein
MTGFLKVSSVNRSKVAAALLGVAMACVACDQGAKGTFDAQLTGAVTATVTGTAETGYTSRISTGALARHYSIGLQFPPTVPGLDRGRGPILAFGTPVMPRAGKYRIVSLEKGEHDSTTIWSFFGIAWTPVDGEIDIQRGGFASNAFESNFHVRMIRDGIADTLTLRGHIRTQ